MYRQARIAVLVPAYNEGSQIAGVVASMPDFVDHVVVVNDASTDDTGDVLDALALHESRLTVIHLEQNRGVGGALAEAYAWAREGQVDIAVTVDGDGQMNPDDMWRLLDPIVEGRVDFTKGNRFTTRDDLQRIPKVRLIGNVTLSVATKIATGYWSLADSQSGYSAAGRAVLDEVPWDRVFARYGRPNDVMWHVSMAGLRAADVPISAVYGVGERSTMKILRTSFAISWLLCRRFWQRMFVKHVLIDFHPMVFLYAIATLAGIASLALFPWVLLGFLDDGQFPKLASNALIVSVATSLNGLFLAFFMDLHAHRHVSLPLQLPTGHRMRPGPGR
jgi:glycosyltransferase involved in cell wall biosynthesis